MSLLRFIFFLQFYIEFLNRRGMVILVVIYCMLHHIRCAYITNFTAVRTYNYILLHVLNHANRRAFSCLPPADVHTEGLGRPLQTIDISDL